MHPILRDPGRLAIYLSGWLVLSALLTVALEGGNAEAWPRTALFVTPLLLAYSFFCLAVWYPCRATPIDQAALSRVLTVHLVGALAASALWQGLAWGWAGFLDSGRGVARAADLYLEHLPLFIAAGVLLYLLAVAVHYLLLAFEASRRAESRALELRLLAQQAEMKALKAQIDPHFLFNSLNSISSLCGSDPAAARHTAIRLGEFLRATLKLGPHDTIPLSEEMALAAAYLEVERARYGERLVYEERIAGECLPCRLPALLLQPLLENALKHGIAHLVAPGRVSIEGRLQGGRLHLAVDNSCDPERPRQTGQGIGLTNVRGRLALIYDGRARLRADDRGNSYRVELVLPLEAAAPDAAAAEEAAR